MKDAIAAEFLKLRTTRTGWWLLLVMLGLVVLAVLLHGFGLGKPELGQAHNQLRVLTVGETLGAVFAALLGALSITAELRHGTIRPTFLASPRRSRVIVAKAIVSFFAGAAFGLIATAVAIGIGTAAFGVRGITSQLGSADYLQLLAGGAAASALWAVVGVGVGSLVRNQVAAIVGIFVWLQIIENLLIDSASKVSRFMPGALAQSMAGSKQGALSSPLAALFLLIVYSLLVVLIGGIRTSRTDVA
jgi:ABC-2 type transport system permease protein